MPPAIKLPKNLEKKKELLFKLYKDATGSTKSAKYKEIIKLTGVGERSLFDYCKEGKWDERIGLQADAQEVAEIAEKLVDNKKLAKKDVAFSEIAGDIKDMCYAMVDASREMCRSNVMLIKYYSKKIEMLVEDAGGIDKLNPYQDQILIKYQNVIAGCKKQIAEYMHPANLTRMLTLIGMQGALGTMPDGVERDAFSPRAIQEALFNGGMVTLLGKDKEVDEVIQQTVLETMSMDSLPEIDAKLVRDEKNNLGKKDE